MSKISEKPERNLPRWRDIPSLLISFKKLTAGVFEFYWRVWSKKMDDNRMTTAIIVMVILIFGWFLLANISQSNITP